MTPANKKMNSSIQLLNSQNVTNPTNMINKIMYKITAETDIKQKISINILNRLHIT